MTMAVSKAVEEGATAVICASTGNTSASAAAYAARAGLTAAVVIPEGKIAAGKLAQALAHGARVLALDGSFDDALLVVRELVRAPPDRPRQQPQRVPHRRPAHRRLRGVRRPRRRARRPLHPGRQRGQHLLVLAGLPGLPRGGALAQAAAALRLPGGRRRPAGGRATRSRGPRPSPPPSASATPPAGGQALEAMQRVRRRRRGRHRLADPRRLPHARRRGGRVLRAGLRGVGGRAHPARRGGRPDARARPSSASSPATG